ncbi:MAG: transposase [Anaerolineae bacterium]
MTHRRRSLRLPDYDYTGPGSYFVTMVTHGRVCWFGDVRDGHVVLNACGLAAQEELQRVASLRPNVDCQPFVVMPNHVHAVVSIIEPAVAYAALPEAGMASQAPTARFGQPAAGSLAAIVGCYKAAVTRRLGASVGGAPIWQRGYHERIVRNEREYQAICRYIAENPQNWLSDREYLR